MEIAKDMIFHYLRYITDYEDLPSDGSLEECYEQAMVLKHDAGVRNDLEPLRLGLDHLLCNPDFDLSRHAMIAIWNNEAVREVIRYIRKVVYPDAPPVNCNEVKSVKLVQMGQYDWWKMRTDQGLHPDLSKQHV